MKAPLAILLFLMAPALFAQNQAADEVLLQRHLAQIRHVVTNAEASAEFVRAQLVALCGKLDYYADPKRSNVRSPADLKDHLNDLNGPVREAILRIYGLKDTLDSLTLTFTQERPQTEATLIHILPNDRYAYGHESIDWPTLKERLNRAGSLAPYIVVKIAVSKSDSAIILSRIVAACQEAQIRSIYFDEQP